MGAKFPNSLNSTRTAPNQFFFMAEETSCNSNLSDKNVFVMNKIRCKINQR